MKTSTARRTLALATVTALLGCARGPAPEPPAPAPSPWSASPLARAAVPSIYTTVWRAAENRATCALLAPRGIAPTDAQSRAATFSGGWAVAYDLPGQRSAFGVAGSGADAWSPDVYDAWPHKLLYADGSRVGYGLEAGAGTKWLAYVRIPGQGCLYNVWSNRGREHLEQLLAELRFVKAE